VKSADSVLDELGAKLRALENPPPRAKAVTSFREKCENRAAETMKAGLGASELAQRAFARRLGIDERLVRDYLSGARAVPLWVLLALPRSGQLGAIRAVLEGVPPDDAESPESTRGAA
jgi:hypothetical protein